MLYQRIQVDRLGSPPSDLLADCVDQVYCPEVVYLRLGARDRAKDWRDEGYHDVVDKVGLGLSAGEVHALGQTGIAHLLLANLEANLVEALVEKEVQGDFHETNCAQNVADAEHPVDAVNIRSPVSNPGVESRCDNQDCHLDRQKMRLEKTVKQNNHALVVDALQSVGGDVREDAAFGSSFGVSCRDLRFGNIAIRGVVQSGMKRAERSGGVLPLSPDLDNLPESIPSIQSTPHVPESLLVPSLHVGDQTGDSLAMTAASNIGLADRAHDGPNGQVTIERKEALEVHVQILANRFGIAIPTADTVNQFERHRVDRSRRGNGRTLVQSGHAGSRPQYIGDTDNSRDVVSIAVKDDRS